MVTIDLYNVDENGQVYFDFDSLENMTDSSFASRVIFHMESYTESSLSSGAALPIVASVESDEYAVIVTIKWGKILSILTYYKPTKTHDLKMMDVFELEKLISLFGGSVQWQK